MEDELLAELEGRSMMLPTVTTSAGEMQPHNKEPLRAKASARSRERERDRARERARERATATARAWATSSLMQRSHGWSRLLGRTG